MPPLARPTSGTGSDLFPPPPPPPPPPPGVAAGEASPFGFPPPPAPTSGVAVAEPWRTPSVAGVATLPSQQWAPAPQPQPQLAPPSPYLQSPTAPANSLATTSLVLGLCSLLMPLLSIPGVILGAISLRHIKQRRAYGGRGRSIAGIVTSLVLGPLVAVGIVLAITHAATHENTAQVQAAVRSLIESDVKARSGLSIDVSVTCPKNEPRRSGTEFSCTASAPNQVSPIEVRIRETDNRGDFVIDGASTTPPGSRTA